MSLFDDWSPSARITGPGSSKKAEEAVQLTSNVWCRRVLAVMVEREDRADLGTTASEAIMRLAYFGEAVPETSSISRRITSLRKLGYVAPVLAAATGEPLERKGGNGRVQTVWASTPLGRAALAEALEQIAAAA